MREKIVSRIIAVGEEVGCVNPVCALRPTRPFGVIGLVQASQSKVVLSGTSGGVHLFLEQHVFCPFSDVFMLLACVFVFLPFEWSATSTRDQVSLFFPHCGVYTRHPPLSWVS